MAQREAERSKLAYRGDHNSLEQLDAVLRQETPPIGLWLDTSEQTPEQTVDAILTRGPAEGELKS